MNFFSVEFNFDFFHFHIVKICLVKFFYYCYSFYLHYILFDEHFLYKNIIHFTFLYLSSCTKISHTLHGLRVHQSSCSPKLPHIMHRESLTPPLMWQPPEQQLLELQLLEQQLLEQQLPRSQLPSLPFQKFHSRSLGSPSSTSPSSTRPSSVAMMTLSTSSLSLTQNAEVVTAHLSGHALPFLIQWTSWISTNGWLSCSFYSLLIFWDFQCILNFNFFIKLYSYIISIYATQFTFLPITPKFFSHKLFFYWFL